MDYTNINALIDSFASQSTPDSISPANVASLLRELLSCVEQGDSESGGITASLTVIRNRVIAVEGSVGSLEESKGKARGLATLDAAGHLPAAQLPSNVATLNSSGMLPDSTAPKVSLSVCFFSGFCHNATLESGGVVGDHSVVYDTARRMFLAAQGLRCYQAFPDADHYNVSGHPYDRTLYVETGTGVPYRWTGSSLEALGCVPGEPFGSATLDEDGKLDESQIPDVLFDTGKNTAKPGIRMQPVPVDGPARNGYPRESCLGLMCPEEIPADCVPVLFRLTKHTRTATFIQMEMSDRDKAKEKCYRRYSTLENYARIRKATADDDLSPAIRYILTFADWESGVDVTDQNGEPQLSSLADDTQFADSEYVERPTFCRVREIPLKDSTTVGTLYTVPWGGRNIWIARKNAGQNRFSKLRKDVRLQCAVAFIRRSELASQGKRNRLTLSMSVTDPVYFYVYPVPNLLQTAGGGSILDRTRPFLFKYGV